MCEVTSWQGALLALWAIVEFWLGRTESLESGSLIELLLNVLKRILAFFGIVLDTGVESLQGKKK